MADFNECPKMDFMIFLFHWGKCIFNDEDVSVSLKKNEFYRKAQSNIIIISKQVCIFFFVFRDIDEDEIWKHGMEVTMAMIEDGDDDEWHFSKSKLTLNDQYVSVSRRNI